MVPNSRGDVAFSRWNSKGERKVTYLLSDLID